MSELIQVKKHVPSGTIILNRPEQRNALSRRMIAELLQAFRDLHLEKRVRAVILTGAGSSFCAGLDLAEMFASSQEPEADQQWHRDAVQFKELIEYILRYPKPVIAAVNGAAMGSGAGLILASDLVIAAPQASILFPEPRWGLVAGLVTPLLQFRAGGSTAARLLLASQTIDAAEAHRLGLVHEVVPHDLVWARGHELAGEIAKAAPESIQLTKKVLNETVGEQLGVWLSAGAAASAAARTTEAAAEGLAAFQQRRHPQW